MNVKKMFWIIIDKFVLFFTRGLGDEFLLLITGTGVAMLLPDLSKILSGKDFILSWKSVIIYLAIIVLLFMFLIQFKVFNIKGQRYFQRSTLLIGILAFLLYVSFITMHNDFNSFVERICTLSCIFLYLLLRSLWVWKISNNKLPIEAKRDDELPIKDKTQDDYWFDAYAKIAAGKIINKETSGVGLLGEYGCGKSSFANLMLNHLPVNSEFIAIKIDGWGLAEGGTIHYILDQIERELYKYTDTLKISRISNEYQNLLLKQSADRTFGLLSIFNRKKPASELVGEINGVLTSINKSIILLLEDLDRNSIDNRLFAEIGSFLDICKKQSNIYFIVPIAELENTKVITRCCKYYHRFLDISSVFPSKIVGLRDKMLAKIKDTTFPVPENSSVDNSIDILFASSNLAELINTPRKMNSIKYFIENQYTPLIGEIEFDDFMIITFLRECNENVRNNEKSGYDFLLEKLPHMQKNINSLKESFSRNLFTPSNIDLDKELKEIKEEMAEAKVPKNQQDLIVFLMNGAAKHQKGQRLLCNEYTNYWLYSWTGQFNIKGKIIEKPKLSDQIILEKIEEINNNTCDIDEFIKWLGECDLIYHKFIQFFDRLEFDQAILALAKKLIANIEISTTRDLNEISKIFLQRVACERIDTQINNGRKLDSWWREVLKDTLLKAPNKVRPITEIILKNIEPVDNKSKQIYKIIAEELKDICLDPKNELIKILSGKPYSTLKDITFDHNSHVSRTKAPRDDTWYFLGDWLFNNVDKAPKLLIGNIIHLTASFGEGVFIPYQFLPYFWNKPAELLELFVDEKYDITFNDDEKLQKAYVQLKTDAKTVLDEFSNSRYGSEFYLWLRKEKYPNAGYWGLFDEDKDIDLSAYGM